MGQRQQLLAVKQLKDQGALDDDGAMRASWRVVLPNDVEQIVAPKPRQINRGTPFGLSEMDNEEKGTTEHPGGMRAYVNPLKTIGNTWSAFGQGAAGKVAAGDLITAYQSWHRDRAVADLPLAKQDQLNQRWDNLMASDPSTSFNWNPQQSRVLALRPTGVLHKIMAASMNGGPLPRTPLGQSVQNANAGQTQRLRKEEPSNPAYANELKDVAPGESSVGTSNAVAGGTPGPAPAPSTNMPAPKTKAEYDALPKGTSYREPSGRVSVKR